MREGDWVYVRKLGGRSGIDPSETYLINLIGKIKILDRDRIYVDFHQDRNPNLDQRKLTYYFGREELGLCIREPLSGEKSRLLEELRAKPNLSPVDMIIKYDLEQEAENDIKIPVV